MWSLQVDLPESNAIPYGWAEDDLSSGDESKNLVPRVPRRAKWDCATILSTYTNTENHPKVLTDIPRSSAASVTSKGMFSKSTGAPKVIKLSAKTGVPVGVPVRGESAKPAPVPAAAEEEEEEDKHDDGSEGSQSDGEPKNLGAARPRDETPEERKQRKKAIKEARKVRP